MKDENSAVVAHLDKIHVFHSPDLLDATGVIRHEADRCTSRLGDSLLLIKVEIPNIPLGHCALRPQAAARNRRVFVLPLNKKGFENGSLSSLN